MDRLAVEGPVLVLAPHPDDESLGCGLLLASAWGGGSRAHVACLTDGAASHPGSRSHPPDRLAALRRSEMLAAVAALGGSEGDVTFLGHPDARLHRVPVEAVAEAIAGLVDTFGIALLVAPSPLDPHCDHEAGAAAAALVASGRPGLRLISYAVWSRWRAGGDVPLPEGASALAFAAPERLPAKRAAIAAHLSQSGGVVNDAPDAFAMPDGFAAMFAAGPEPYFEVAR